MTRAQNLDTRAHPETLALCIQAPYNKTKNIQPYFDEFFNLIKSNGTPYDHALIVKLREIHPNTFLTPGKLEEVREFCAKKNIKQVIISEPLTAQQERKIEDYIGCIVVDRTMLILDIFKKAAHSAEGKMQVEVAYLEHKKTRLAGKGIHLEQQRGTIGMMSGFGETLKEKEKRFIENLINKINRQLHQLQTRRDTQRKQRITSKVPHLCLIGYTNAGKSTIINALTKANVLAEDKLFATLDTTTRELYIDGVKKGLISDTVGFIQYLPHKLIDAFKSTLSELQYASLLLHVIDCSDPDWQAHIDVVHEILQDLEVDKPILYIFNKADCLNEEELAAFNLAIEGYEPRVIIAATSKPGTEPLISFLRTWHG